MIGVTHTIAGGFCTVCGDTEEWLLENVRPGDVIEWETFELSAD